MLRGCTMKRKNKIFLLTGLAIVFLLFIAWKPLRLDRYGLPFVAIDWVDAVRIDDLTYESNIKPRIEVPAAEIGEKLGSVRFTLYENVSNSNYRLRNGDATFLPKGTAIYAIRNDTDSVAVFLDGKYYRFDIEHPQ